MLGAESADADPTELNREALAVFVRSHKGAIQDCYEAELKKNPKLKGKIVMRFTITPDGTTDGVVVEENSLSGDEVASCASEVIQRWTFPIRPREPVPVAYPFVFAPAR
jgi:TonB family protein